MAFKLTFIYLKDHLEHPDAVVNPTLLWEYDLCDFDFQQMRDVVVQKVIERGWPTDWHAILNLYGVEGVRTAIKTIPYLNDMDMNFVSKVFEIPFSKMRSYKEKQLRQSNWSS